MSINPTVLAWLKAVATSAKRMMKLWQLMTCVVVFMVALASLTTRYSMINNFDLVGVDYTFPLFAAIQFIYAVFIHVRIFLYNVHVHTYMSVYVSW